MDKRYEEALEKARQVKHDIETMGCKAIDIDMLDVIFPELDESEDEKIRTRLIALVESFGQGTYKNEMLAYLEKQKEQKPSIEEVLIKAGLHPYKDGNQWYILIGNNIQEGICGFGDTIDDALCHLLREAIAYQKEQKPAEWSEEDTQMLNCCIEEVSWFNEYPWSC